MQLALFQTSQRKTPPPADLFGDDDPDGARWYQREAYEAVLEKLRSVDSTLVVQATGLGKTYLFCMLAKYWKGRVLVLAHRDELIQQTVKQLEWITEEPVEVEQADLRSSKHCRLVVGSVQTLCREKRLAAVGDFDLVVVDECQHAPAKSYVTILKHLSGAKVVGFTATPDRADEKALAQVFAGGEPAHVFDIQDGIEAGFLVPVRVQRVEIGDIDLSHVRKSKTEGGLNVKQLDEEMIKGIEGIVQKTIELGEERQAICFFPGVRTAAYAAERFNAVSPGSARFISGETNRDERRVTVEAFRRGEFRYLCNCAVATEGFDAPTTEMIVLGRPTTSRALCAQMVGRGTRVLPGIIDPFPDKSEADIRRELISKSSKPELLVLDFVAMLGSGGHTLVGPEDALGGNYTNEEIEHAKKITKKEGGNGEVLKNLTRARNELRMMAEALKKKVEVRAKVTEVDPFGIFHLKRKDIQRADMRFGWDPATDKQTQMLRNAGVKDEDLEQMGKREASKLISTVISRRRLGLANLKQLRILKEFGVDKINVSRESASRGIDVIKRAGWGRRGGVPVEMIKNAMGIK